MKLIVGQRGGIASALAGLHPWFYSPRQVQPGDTAAGHRSLFPVGIPVAKPATIAA